MGSSDNRFSMLRSILPPFNQNNLANNELTLFAPTNDAFAEVPEEVLDSLLEDPEALEAVLLRDGTGFRSSIMEGSSRWLPQKGQQGSSRQTSRPLMGSSMPLIVSSEPRILNITIRLLKLHLTFSLVLDCQYLCID